MKKVLSILGLIVMFSMTTPVFASPHGPGGPGGHGAPHGGPHGGVHRIHAGAHHRHHIEPRHHYPGGGVRIYAGHHPRHSYWYGYGPSYRWCPWCGYRLGHCPHYPAFGAHIPLGGANFSLSF